MFKSTRVKSGKIVNKRVIRERHISMATAISGIA